MTVDLRLGDCLEVMPSLPDGSVDAIITDLPYGNGTILCEWDAIVPLEPMWDQVKRLLKPKGAFITTAIQPFTSILVMSNVKMFKYEWVWIKNRGSNFSQVKRAPRKEHENVLVFGNGTLKYNPQMQPRTGGGVDRVKSSFKTTRNKVSALGVEIRGAEWLAELRYPSSWQKFNCEVGFHPTQKPVRLYEYLIRTYTNEGNTVLDFCMGSGTTGVACVNTNRNFIGIEIMQDYFEIAKQRIADAELQYSMTLQ